MLTTENIILTEHQHVNRNCGLSMLTLAQLQPHRAASMMAVEYFQQFCQFYTHLTEQMTNLTTFFCLHRTTLLCNSVLGSQCCQTAAAMLLSCLFYATEK